MKKQVMYCNVCTKLLKQNQQVIDISPTYRYNFYAPPSDKHYLKIHLNCLLRYQKKILADPMGNSVYTSKDMKWIKNNLSKDLKKFLLGIGKQVSLQECELFVKNNKDVYRLGKLIENWFKQNK